MVKRFCPSCRAENLETRVVCLICGSSLESPPGEEYIDMLVWALDHQEPETRIRAATILGQLGPRASRALFALTRVYRKTVDVYLRSAIVTAAGAIGGVQGHLLILHALKDRSVVPRLAAVEALTLCVEQLPQGLSATAMDALRQLAETDQSPSVREAATAALTKLAGTGHT